MKFSKILFVALLQGAALNAQDYQADTLRIPDLTERSSEFKNYSKIRFFELDNGFVIGEGTKVIVTEPAVSNFEFQTLYRGNITTSVLLGGAKLHRNFSGKEYIVTRIFVAHNGISKHSELGVGINLGIEGGKGAIASSEDLLASLETGELKIVGMLTREQAISKMLETKELYEAGFLTEEEFEVKKAELRKFVK